MVLKINRKVFNYLELKSTLLNKIKPRVKILKSLLNSYFIIKKKQNFTEF